jgi:hypothetical protein
VPVATDSVPEVADKALRTDTFATISRESRVTICLARTDTGPQPATATSVIGDGVSGAVSDGGSGGHAAGANDFPL